MVYYVYNSEKFILAGFFVELDALDYLEKLNCYGPGYAILRGQIGSIHVGTQF